MIKKRIVLGGRGALAGLMAVAALGGLAANAIAAGSGGVTSTGGTGGYGTGTSDEGVFPLPKGHHTYGDGIGAGRGHQGQDIMTKCGKPIVAAQSGRIDTVDYQSAAGNYVVIDGRGKANDTVYMHLLHRSPVREGQRVRAGQQLGLVGQTGDATACHLHFEMWSPPGWYKGGSVVDPLPFLKRWDKTS